jgi:hypothetical protein
MATESFLVTALPHSADPAHPVHVSLFVAHRLIPDEAEGQLREFPTVARWTAALADATITLRGRGAGGGVLPIACTPDLSPLRPAQWELVFPGDMAVRGWKQRPFTDVPWRTFAAHRMRQHAMLVHAAGIFSSPVAAPGVGTNVLTRPAMNALGLGQFTRRFGIAELLNPDLRLDQWATEQLDELTGDGFLGRGETASDAANRESLGLLVHDVHCARRYYQRDEEQTPYQDRPTPGAVGDPLRVPTPDFHERASMLGDLSPLLRQLGLVIDISVDDVGLLSSIVEIEADIVVPGLTNATPNQPRTACAVAGRTFAATSRTGDYLHGMLRVGDEERFTVLDLDPDASALKIENYLRNLPRLLATEANGDQVNSAPPTLRATGLAIARNDRAARLRQHLDDSANRTDALLNGTGPALQIEDLARGVRVEVWDDVSNEWHSLHHRVLDVIIDGAGLVIDDVADVGFLQGASLTRADNAQGGVPGAPLHAHEVLAGWDGWSLSAPRPGKMIVHQDGDEVLQDAPTPATNPVNPVASMTRVAPRTLPWLRYGRSYAFRAWAADLAGNSSPHRVAGAGAANADADAAAAAATAAAVTRLANSPADAVRGAGEERYASPTAALREELRVVRPAPTVGPVERDGSHTAQDVPITGAPDIDAVVRERHTNRLRSRTRAATQAVRQTALDQHFAVHADQHDIWLQRTDATMDPRTVAVAFGSAAQTHANGMDATTVSALAELVAALSDVVTTPRPFLRWDPVIEPAVVPRHPYTEAESLLTLVIRSGVEPPAAEGDPVTLVDPAQFAAATTASHPFLHWREDSQRHVAPPKTSQFEAELHGRFDTAVGSSDPVAIRSMLATALRESGTFLDVTIADIATPGARITQPGIAFHHGPTAEVPTVTDPADLPRGEPLGTGQYVVHDIDSMRLPYLPDPLAVGLSMVFPDAGQDHTLTSLVGVEGVTHRYSGDWPEPQPARFVLRSGVHLGAAIDGDTITFDLPPGEQLRFRLSSALDRSTLAQLGLWRSLPTVLQQFELLAEAAADGWLWWLTPALEMRLVHAVPRPVEVPRTVVLRCTRRDDDTAVTINGAVDVHGPSTQRLDLEATWTEWVDDPAKPAPQQITVQAAAADTVVGYDDDIVVIGGDKDATVPIPGDDPIHVHAMIHKMADTKHRNVDYTFRATTRYREYFDPLVVPTPDDVSLVGPSTRIDVPNTARPPKPVVRDVLPLFRWFEETEPDQPFALRRERRSGLRVYLDRPWYMTGDDELLGVVVAFGNDATVANHVSHWGADPVYWQQGPPTRSVIPLMDILHFAGLDDRPQSARPVGPPTPRALIDVPGRPVVWVVGYAPEFSSERGLWFVDVAVDQDTAFWPFVRLSVARFQPSSNLEKHLSPVVRCDYCQLPPERIATLSRPDDGHARVVVTGPIGVPLTSLDPPRRRDFVQMLLDSRTMRVRLEQRVPSIPTDLGWRTLTTMDLPVLGIDGTTVSWSGTIDLPAVLEPQRPGTNDTLRVTIEEWERLPADPVNGAPSSEARMVYADHLPL